MQVRSTFVLAAGLCLAAPLALASQTDAGHGVSAMALYSHGMAVVQDTRNVDLEAGEQRLPWPTTGKVQPATFWLAGSGVTLEGLTVATKGQHPHHSLSDRIGKSVTLKTPDGKSRKGQLVSLQGDTAFVRIDDRIERVTAASPVSLSWIAGKPRDSHPGSGGHGRETSLHIHVDSAGKQELTALYQTDAPSWSASYTGRYDPKSGKLALSSQAVIDNQGHAALNAKKAWLVAGKIARVSGGQPKPLMMARMAKNEAASSTSAPQSVGHGYRYALEGGLHVPAGTVRMVALMSPVKVQAKRHFRFENFALAESGPNRTHARVSLSFDNTSDQPLPAGVIRIYDAAHTAQLLGETHLGDTPTQAPVNLALGSAFDLTGTHDVVEKTTNDDNATTYKVCIELFNAGDKAQQVTVAEQLPANAHLAEDAPDTHGGSANRPEWQLEVPANGHKSFSYRFIRPKSS